MSKKQASRRDKLILHTESVRELVTTDRLASVVGGTYIPSCAMLPRGCEPPP
jgi:hypothetical protein